GRHRGRDVPPRREARRARPRVRVRRRARVSQGPREARRPEDRLARHVLGGLVKKIALALVLVLGASLAYVRGQDEGEKAEKKYHVTVSLTGFAEPVELDNMRTFKQKKEGWGGSIEGGGEAWFAADKVAGWVAEPMVEHKKQQEEKAPK